MIQEPLSDFRLTLICFLFDTDAVATDLSEDFTVVFLICFVVRFFILEHALLKVVKLTYVSEIVGVFVFAEASTGRDTKPRSIDITRIFAIFL
jgi:hypothetical protein